MTNVEHHISVGDHFWTDESDMLKDAKKKAAKLGANGVLVERMKEPGTSAKVAEAVIGTEANRRAELVAIYILPDDQHAPAVRPRVYQVLSPVSGVRRRDVWLYRWTFARSPIRRALDYLHFFFTKPYN